jgi:hypothetical protein
MKGILIGCTCIILALLLWATLSSPVESQAQCAVGQAVVRASSPVYTYGVVVGWAEWIRLPRRRRPRFAHNPRRRYRLTKKQRRRLRRRLRCMPKRGARPGLSRESSILPAGVVQCPPRCS